MKSKANLTLTPASDALEGTGFSSAPSGPPRRRHKRKRRRLAGSLSKNAWLRTVLTSIFVLFMLASAHLFMVVINAAEYRHADPRPADGQIARMFNDVSMVEELELARISAKSDADRAVIDAALVRAQAGEDIELRTLPMTDFLGTTAIVLSLLGLFVIWLTSRFKTDAAQTILGVFGGNLLWTGSVEYGLMSASRILGVGKVVGVHDGELVALFGEYVLLKHTWGPLALICAYLLFLESSRCTLFLWWRRNVPTMRGPLVTGRIGNYGPRSAFQYTTTVWAFYLLLLWAYDEHLFGVHSLFTKGLLFATAAGSIYLLVRLHQQKGWGPAVRYAIAAMIVVWTPVEIFAKWGVLKEPWLLLEPGTAAVFFGGLAVGTWALWRAQRRPQRGCPVNHGALSSEDDAREPPLDAQEAAAIAAEIEDALEGKPRSDPETPMAPSAVA
ncbi:MAG: hypothetical protein AAF447_03475 [Myxococcota bacterium]